LLIRYKMTFSVDFFDFDVKVPENKGKKDIMTPMMAIKSSKSTKDHKLKPRSNKRDRTKTDEAKTRAKNRRYSHSCIETWMDVN
jgi:hypothetical protein